jgi:hypothetical protein
LLIAGSKVTETELDKRDEMRHTKHFRLLQSVFAVRVFSSALLSTRDGSVSKRGEETEWKKDGEKNLRYEVVQK